MSKRVLLSLSSVLLLSLAWLGGGGLFLLPAFVPLLLLLEGFDKGRRNFWKAYGWVALTLGLWCLATVWWVWYAAAVGTIAATIVQMTLFGAVLMCYHYLRLRSSRSFAYVVLVTGWIAAEHLYLRGQVSFPWLLLGNGFANQTWAVQWYEWTGVFGGTLWVLIANLAIFEAVRTGNVPFSSKMSVTRTMPGWFMLNIALASSMNLPCSLFISPFLLPVAMLTLPVDASRLQKSFTKNSFIARRWLSMVCSASYVQPKPPLPICRLILYLPPCSSVPLGRYIVT